MTPSPHLPATQQNHDLLAGIAEVTPAEPAVNDNARQPDPTSEESARGEFTGGSRGNLSGRNDDQNRAAGIDDPIAEGSRQGRERYKSDIASGTDNDGQHSV